MSENAISDADRWRLQALTLIEQQKTMVLSTCAQNKPWAAPVYFIFIAPAFYFFSSPRSKHMEHGLENPHCAAAIFSDSDRWEQLEGLQMIGRINPIHAASEKVKVTANYLKKYPLARRLMSGKASSVIDLSTKVGLYAFFPSQIYYMNNRMGFGNRIELDMIKGNKV